MVNFYSILPGPVDYSCLPESLRYIKRKQGSLKWRKPSLGTSRLTKMNSNRNFWKNLIYYMPSVPTGRLQTVVPSKWKTLTYPYVLQMGSTIVTSGSSGLFPGHTFIFEATFTMTFTLCAIRSERLSTWYRSRVRYQWYTFVPQVTSFQPLFWSSRFDLSLRQYFMKATTWFREREKTFFITTCFVMFCFLSQDREECLSHPKSSNDFSVYAF